MKKSTLKRTKWSKFLHGVLVLIVIVGFVATAASFTQAVTTSDSVISRVVNHDDTLGFVRIGFVSLGVTALALIMFAFSTAARGMTERKRNNLLMIEIEECRKDIKQLKMASAKSKAKKS